MSCSTSTASEPVASGESAPGIRGALAWSARRPDLHRRPRASAGSAESSRLEIQCAPGAADWPQARPTGSDRSTKASVEAFRRTQAAARPSEPVRTQGIPPLHARELPPTPHATTRASTSQHRAADTQRRGPTQSHRRASGHGPMTRYPKVRTCDRIPVGRVVLDRRYWLSVLNAANAEASASLQAFNAD